MKIVAERSLYSNVRSTRSLRVLTGDAAGPDPLPWTGDGGRCKSLWPHFGLVLTQFGPILALPRGVMLLADVLQPHAPDTISPRCRPPGSLETNNYYANLNESRPQPTTGNINIKAWAPIEGRGRSVMNSITTQHPAATKKQAGTRSGCGQGAPDWTPSHLGNVPPEDTTPYIWILALGSELKGYLRLCQLLLIW